MSKRVTSDPDVDKGTARAWCYTFFLQDEARPVPCGIGDGDAPDEQANELHAHLRYFVAQREVCPETGRIHWQAYGEFKDPVKGAAIFRAIRVCRRDQRFVELRRGEVHWERRRGRRDQARDYCRKNESRDPRPGSGPFEFGMFHFMGTASERALSWLHHEAIIDLYMNGEVDDTQPMCVDFYTFVPCIKL